MSRSPSTERPARRGAAARGRPSAQGSPGRLWALVAALLLLGALALGGGYLLGNRLLRQTLHPTSASPPGQPAAGDRSATGKAGEGSGGGAKPSSPPPPVEIPGTALTLYRLEVTGFPDSAAAVKEAARLTASGTAAEPAPDGRSLILMYFATRRGAQTYAAALPPGLSSAVSGEVLRPVPVQLPGGAGAEPTRQAVEALTGYIWAESQLWEQDFIGSTASAEDAVQRSRQLAKELAAARSAFQAAGAVTPPPSGLAGLGSLLQLAEANQRAVASWAAGSPDRQTVVEAMSTFTRLVMRFQGWYRSLGSGEAP